MKTKSTFSPKSLRTIDTAPSSNFLTLRKQSTSRLSHKSKPTSRNIKAFSFIRKTKTSPYNTMTIPTLQSMKEPSTSSGTKGHAYQATNSISYKERNLIRSIPKRELKFDLPFSEYALPQFESFNSIHKKISNNNILQMLSDNLKKSINDKSSFHSSRPVTAKKKRVIKYTLKDLMNKNPYHLVSKRVQFSPLMENTYISPQMNEFHGGSAETFGNSKNNDIFFNKAPKTVFSNSTLKFVNKKEHNHIDLLSRLLSMVHEINISSLFKNAIKYEAIKLLWKKNSLTIEKLIIFYKDYKWFLEKKEKLSLNVFTEFLHLIKLEKTDSGFSDRVYLIFDTEKTGYINIKDFFFFMKLTSNNSDFYDKIAFITDLLVDLHKGQNTINIRDINSLFKQIISSDNYRKGSKKLIDVIKERYNKDNDKNYCIDDIFISKEECFDFLEQCEYIKTLMLRFEKDYQKSNIVYEEELMNAFKNNMRNSKNYITNHEIREYCYKYIDHFDRELEMIQKCEVKKEKIKKILEDDESYSIL